MVDKTNIYEPNNIAREHISNLHLLWKKVHDKGYPHDYQDVTTKSIPLIKSLAKLKDKNVLDIGCNSGLYSLLVGCVAKSVIGCDMNENVIARAKIGKEFFDTNIYSTHAVMFSTENFVSQLNNNINAIIASCVLYHIGDDNLSILRDFLAANNCSILIQVRPDRIGAFKKNAEGWGVISTTKIYNGMYTIEDNLDFLRDCGYENATVTGLNSKFYSEYFPVIYSEKF